MKKLIIILLPFFITTINYAQTWTTQITPNNSSESAFKLIKTIDGGFVTVLDGVDEIDNIPQNISYNKIAVVKLDVNGNIVFNKKINVQDSSDVRINDFIELPTGEFLLSGGIIEKTYNGQASSILVKTTAMGDTLWIVRNSGKSGACNSVYGCPNLIDFSNRFWTVDALLSGPFDTLNYFIYEYDYNGNLLNINYQDTMVSYGFPPKLFKDLNDTVLVLADWKVEGILYKKMDALLNKFNLSPSPFMSFKTTISANGNMADGANDLFIVTGQIDSIWHHAAAEYEFSWGVGTSQANTNICNTSDGGYAIIGDTWNAIVNNIYLIKTDALGNQQFGEMYWSVTTHNIDVVQANDYGYVMMNGGAGLWIVKTDQNGTIGVEKSNFLKNEVVLYPNPTNNQFNLLFTKPTSAQLNIYNIAGQQVFTANFINTKHYQSTLNLPNGLYIVTIQSANQNSTKKLVINN